MNLWGEFDRPTMRPQLVRADNGRVTSHTVHVDLDVRIDDLDVRIDGGQIIGHAKVGLSQPGPFLNWLGFFAALDRPVGDASSTEGPVPGSAAAMGSAGKRAGAQRGSGQ
jgi:hypothetical protein